MLGDISSIPISTFVIQCFTQQIFAKHLFLHLELRMTLKDIAEYIYELIFYFFLFYLTFIFNAPCFQVLYSDEIINNN